MSSIQEKLEFLFKTKFVEFCELIFKNDEFSILTDELTRRINFLASLLHRLKDFKDITELKKNLEYLIEIVEQGRIQSLGESVEECLICLDSQTQNVMICCRKSVCDDCIVKIKDDTCPFCRASTKAGDYSTKNL